jgi:hypothetical protein
MGLGRSAQAGRPSPLLASVRPPFPCTRKIFNPKALEALPFIGERAICTRRPSTSLRERREIEHLEGSTHKWRRRKTPSEE